MSRADRSVLDYLCDLVPPEPINLYRDSACTACCQEAPEDCQNQKVVLLPSVPPSYTPIGSTGSITTDYDFITITNNRAGKRLWSFTISGTVSAPRPVGIQVLYTFDPSCSVPNGFDQQSLEYISFLDNAGQNNEDLQGIISVNGQTFGSSDGSVLQFLWLPELAYFYLYVGLDQLAGLSWRPTNRVYFFLQIKDDVVSAPTSAGKFVPA